MQGPPPHLPVGPPWQPRRPRHQEGLERGDSLRQRLHPARRVPGGGVPDGRQAVRQQGQEDHHQLRAVHLVSLFISSSNGAAAQGSLDLAGDVHDVIGGVGVGHVLCQPLQCRVQTVAGHGTGQVH